MDNIDSIQIGLTLRDWMALGGVILILGVLIDAFRRLKQDQNEILDNTASNNSLDEDLDYTDLSLLSELPNGGSRVIDRNEIEQSCTATLSATDDDTVVESRNVEITNDLGITNARRSDDATEKIDGTGHSKNKLLLAEDTEVLALNIVSKEGLYFSGNEILSILLEHELRFGDMGFFHRHEEAAGRGAILFSVADMIKPGIFDIENISTLQTRGLVFFLTLPGPIHMLSAFETMLQTATSVANQLQGDLRDETRSVLTQQALDYHRQRINELEHRRLVRAQ